MIRCVLLDPVGAVFYRPCWPAFSQGKFMGGRGAELTRTPLLAGLRPASTLPTKIIGGTI